MESFNVTFSEKSINEFANVFGKTLDAVTKTGRDHQTIGIPNGSGCGSR